MMIFSKFTEFSTFSTDAPSISHFHHQIDKPRLNVLQPTFHPPKKHIQPLWIEQQVQSLELESFCGDFAANALDSAACISPR